ncbi:UNVERIFIED_ORG: hypothetical protein ABID33_003333 [Xanthobacter viscosus]|uniref:Uncharacterized protein n=1 Tax=Xanthobacter autotrophicus TaxID=280 RepID=A0A6C1KKK6_XANAU|nr:hypothetical protein [Xanthobacter autotrophicus]TLX44789.1 hypothetical protein FBQ73_01705 [Xanthobacter autotrophicus]
MTTYCEDLNALEARLIGSSTPPNGNEASGLVDTQRMPLVEACIDFIEAHRHIITRDAVLRMANHLTGTEFCCVVMESALGVAGAHYRPENFRIPHWEDSPAEKRRTASDAEARAATNALLNRGKGGASKEIRHNVDNRAMVQAFFGEDSDNP